MSAPQRTAGDHAAVLLGDLPRLASQQYAGQLALAANARTLSFREVDALVDRLAGKLRATGLLPGQRVVLHLPNGWRWVVTYYAIARMGGVVVPANTILADAEVEHLLVDSGASALVTSVPRSPHIARAAAQVGATIIADTDQADLISIDGLLAEPAAPAAAFATPAPEDPAVICYTSGTTGRPKGAVLSHRAITLNAQLSATMHGRSSTDRMLSALPCAHIYGMLVVNMAFTTGAGLVLHEKFDPDAVASDIARWACTTFDGVPTMYYHLLASERFLADCAGKLRLCVVGGQSMPTDRMANVIARLGCRFIEAWGMTELAGIGMSHPRYAPGPLGSIGTTLPFHEARLSAVSDPAEQSGGGEAGELLVRGPTTMSGYWGRPDATAEVLDADGWLSTGDVATRDADGYFYVVDRAKEMIISGGYNVYPSEVERVIAGHPAVAIVAVGGVPHEIKGESVAAFVALREGEACSEDEVLALCRAHLAPYKAPRLVRFVTDFPKTSSGKIVRTKLWTLLDRDADPSPNAEGPRAEQP